MHYTDVRNECRRNDCRFVCLGKINVQNKHITVRVQTEIPKFVMGTHKTLTNDYPERADFRQKNWRSWIAGDTSADQYQCVHLAYIALHFCDIWDAPVVKGMNPRDITPTILDLFKNEIVEMMVCMHHLPAAMLDRIALRRSRRKMAVSDDVEIIPAQHKQARLTPSLAPCPETDDDENDGVDVYGGVLRLFNFSSALKAFWKNGKQKEVGRREMERMATYADKPYRAVCLEISTFGGMPYSMDEYKAIESLSKSDMSRKQLNFDRLRTWINDSLPFEHMRVRDGQLLLEFARTVERFNEDVNLTNEVMKKGNLPQKPRPSFGTFSTLIPRLAGGRL